MGSWNSKGIDQLPLTSMYFSSSDFLKSSFRVDLRVKISELKDPKKIAKGVGHNNWSIISVNEPGEIPYALSLIKQAYDGS